MHRIAIELTRRAFTVRVELEPEETTRPTVVVDSGAITLSQAPGLAKTRPSNVVFLRKVVGL